ncbi:Os01g0132150 [Oryza sativa Japonica Group]|uniref:Os01g0132150 protein n=1 Tax=Oryza sativa subsp. japonica TaxID=39947 RepID=A0A0P0UXS8_ORYSJ|nr:Os01g0132150 [Oryza sativa Japonica Group]
MAMARAAELRAAPHGWLAQRLASVVAAHGGVRRGQARPWSSMPQAIDASAVRPSSAQPRCWLRMEICRESSCGLPGSRAASSAIRMCSRRRVPHTEIAAA